MYAPTPSIWCNAHYILLSSMLDINLKIPKKKRHIESESQLSNANFTFGVSVVR